MGYYIIIYNYNDIILGYEWNSTGIIMGYHWHDNEIIKKNYSTIWEWFILAINDDFGDGWGC